MSRSILKRNVSCWIFDNTLSSLSFSLGQSILTEAFYSLTKFSLVNMCVIFDTWTNKTKWNSIFNLSEYFTIRHFFLKIYMNRYPWVYYWCLAQLWFRWLSTILSPHKESRSFIKPVNCKLIERVKGVSQGFDESFSSKGSLPWWRIICLII